LLQLYGEDVIRPNHHYATDVPDCIRDFGPLVGFWTFLFERLNKILKSYNSANHSGGELEVSFFREFHRTILHSRVVRRHTCRCWFSLLILTQMSNAAAYGDVYMRVSIDAMRGVSADNRGTFQALAQDIAEHAQDGQ
jgi:hypothetical protein